MTSILYDVNVVFAPFPYTASDSGRWRLCVEAYQAYEASGCLAACRKFPHTPSYIFWGHYRLNPSCRECQQPSSPCSAQLWSCRRVPLCLKTLHASDRMKDAFPEPPLVAYRRDANLEDILVHKKHNKMFFRNPNRSGPCGAQRCAICPYMIDADSFEDAASKKYTVRNSVDCKSSTVVYAVFCERCQAYVYVGETGDTLYQRHLLNFAWWCWRSCMSRWETYTLKVVFVEHHTHFNVYVSQRSQIQFED